jgi:hypothetical protein
MPVKATLIFWSLAISCSLVLGNFALAYAAPCYGTGMPQKNKISLGLESYAIFKRYLENDYGKLRSAQYFLDLSYGVFDWLAIDLKGGFGNIRQHPIGSDEIDYPTRLGGGYGFRLKFYDRKDAKMVFGFQHISIHPYAVSIGAMKHKAVLDDWQFSILASYNLKKVTPYLGTRWSRLDYIHWQDGERSRIKSASGKNIGLIVGADIALPKNLWINLEGSFFDSEALAFSLKYNF